jgi:alpha-1,3-rhamnosyl/mannosyltransferase
VLAASDDRGRPDGIGIYTRELERALIEQGVAVRRVGRPARAAMPRNDAPNGPLRYPLPWEYSVAAASALHVSLPFAGSIERAIDVYHATDYVVPRFSRTRVVATLHDAIPVAHPDWANPRFRRVKNRLLRGFAKSAHLVIAISHAAIPDLVRHYSIDPTRIRVVPLGVDAQWFVAPAVEAIEALRRSRGVHHGYFLHVGTLQPRKNLDALINAYERLPPVVRARRQLVIVGKYGWGVATLRERLRSLRGAGRVVWLEYIERDALRALYHGAHAFVFPSLAEGFGLPMLEALAAGVPVVASDLPALREVAQGHARFVVPNSIDALVDAMVDADRMGCDTRTSEARRSHARRFTWQASALRTLDIYRELTR